MKTAHINKLMNGLKPAPIIHLIHFLHGIYI